MASHRRVSVSRSALGRGVRSLVMGVSASVLAFGLLHVGSALPYGLVPVAHAAPAQTYELDINVATGVRPRAVVLGAKGQLLLRDRSSVNAPVSNVGIGATDLGVEARTRDVYSEPTLTLRDRATITGAAVVSGSSVVRGNGTTISGGTALHTSFADPEGKSFLVNWPAGTAQNFDIQPGQSLTLSPGVAYGSISIKSRATLTIPAGEVFVGAFDIEPQATVILQDQNGKTSLYVRDSMIWRGTLTTQSGKAPDWFVGFLGTQTVPLEAPFQGLLVAPSASLTLGTVSGQYIGQFFAKSIEAQPDTVVVFRASSFLQDPPGASVLPDANIAGCTQTSLQVVGPPVQDGSTPRYRGVSTASALPACTLELCNSDDPNAPRVPVSSLNSRLNDPSTPTQACVAEGKVTGDACRIDPSTIDKSHTCNADTDCAGFQSGAVCSEYCVNDSCTSKARGCARRYDCTGADDDSKGCDVSPIYQCTNPLDVGVTHDTDVTAQLPGTSSVVTQIPPAQQAHLNAYRSLSNVTYCNTDHVLDSGTVTNGDPYQTPTATGGQSAVSAEQESGAPIKLGSKNWELFVTPRLFHKAAVNHARLDQFGIDLRAEGSLVAGAIVLGHAITALDVNGGASVTQCGVDTSGRFELFGDTIAALPSTVTTSGTCNALFQSLQTQGRQLEEALVFASQLKSMYASAPTVSKCAFVRDALKLDPDFCVGEPYTPEQLVNFAVARYTTIATQYAASRAQFLTSAASSAATSALGNPLDINEPFSVVGVHTPIPIGPISIVIDAQLYGAWGIKGGLDFNLDMGHPVGGVIQGDPKATAGAHFTPAVSLDVSLYVGVGIDIGIAGASVGLEGVLTLVGVDAPVAVSIGVQRQSVPETSLDPSHDYTKSDFKGTPIAGIPIGQAYRWTGTWNFGAGFDLTTLSGDLNAAARVHFLFFSKTFRKKVAHWEGFEKNFNIASVGGNFSIGADGLFDPAQAFKGGLGFGDFGEVYAYTNMAKVGAGNTAALDQQPNATLGGCQPVVK